MATITETTWGAAGTHAVGLPAGKVGDYMELVVVVDQAPPITAPTGWTLEGSFRTSAPILRTYSRTRQAGDNNVSIGAGAAGSMMVIDYPPQILSSLGAAPPNPVTITHEAGGDPGRHLLVVAWSTDTGYIDTASDFTRLAIASRAGLTLSAYESRAFGDTATFEDTVGTFWYLLGHSYDPSSFWYLGKVGHTTTGGPPE